MYRCFALLLILLGFLCSIIVTGCDSDSSTHFPPSDVTYTTYSSDAAGFSIRFPKAWPREYNTDDDLKVKATSPKENDSDPYQETAGVIVVYMDSDRTLEDYHLRNKGALATIYNDYDFHIAHEADTRINGKDAKVLEFTYTWNNVTSYYQEFEVVSGDRAYVVLNTSTSDAFTRFSNLFAEIGHTLSISYTGSHEDEEYEESRAALAENASPCVRAAIAAGMK